MKLFLIFVITVLLLQAFVACSLSHSTATDFAAAGVEEEGDAIAVAKTKTHHPKKINCGHACSRRCKKSSRKNVCHRACNTCCHRCNCVPPGTYGNKHLCPCYARQRTHGNKPKCP